MHTSARKACARGRIRGCASAAADVAPAEATARASTVARDCQYWLSKTHKSGACQG